MIKTWYCLPVLKQLKNKKSLPILLLKNLARLWWKLTIFFYLLSWSIVLRSVITKNLARPWRKLGIVLESPVWKVVLRSWLPLLPSSPPWGGCKRRSGIGSKRIDKAYCSWPSLSLGRSGLLGCLYGSKIVLWARSAWAAMGRGKR